MELKDSVIIRCSKLSATTETKVKVKDGMEFTVAPREGTNPCHNSNNSSYYNCVQFVIKETIGITKISNVRYFRDLQNPKIREEAKCYCFNPVDQTFYGCAMTMTFKFYVVADLIAKERVENVTIAYKLNILPKMKKGSFFEHKIELKNYEHLKLKCIFQHVDCVVDDQRVENSDEVLLHILNPYEEVEIDVNNCEFQYRKLLKLLFFSEFVVFR